jgi:predicted dehydrogenase
MSDHRILVVGTGSIGTRHVRCLLQTGRAEVGICEPNAAYRQRVADQYGIPSVFTELDESLQQPWDAAVLAVPAPLHVPLARQLVERGIGVLIEKPLAVEEAGVARLAAAVEARGVAAAVAYVYRAHPAIQAVREALRADRFGPPLQLICVSGQPFHHFRPAYRDIYYADRKQGGGAIQDGVTHAFNACEWLLGPITRLSVDAAHRALEGVDVEDTVNVLARHGESVLGCYAINHHQAPNESLITIVCSCGTIKIKLKEYRWEWMTEPGGQWRHEATPLADYDAWFTRQEHAFLDHLEGRAAPLCSLTEAWQTLRVNRAALKSADRDGQWQRVEPPVRPGVKATV